MTVVERTSAVAEDPQYIVIVVSAVVVLLAYNQISSVFADEVPVV
jgi:hypothetical protein